MSFYIIYISVYSKITIYIAIDLFSKSIHHCVNVLTKATNTNYFSFQLLILDCDIPFFFPSLASYRILNSVTNTINLINIAQISTHLCAPLTRQHCPTFTYSPRIALKGMVSNQRKCHCFSSNIFGVSSTIKLTIFVRISIDQELTRNTDEPTTFTLKRCSAQCKNNTNFPQIRRSIYPHSHLEVPREMISDQTKLLPWFFFHSKPILDVRRNFHLRLELTHEHCQAIYANPNKTLSHTGKNNTNLLRVKRSILCSHLCT